MKTKLERINAALFVEHRVAMEPGGDALLRRRAGQQITGELLDRELIERHVRIDRVDHPIAVRPDRTIAVLLVAIRVGVAREVEPLARPTLAILRRGKKAVDQTCNRAEAV